MKKILFVLSVISLFSCGQNSNPDGAKIQKYDSTIVGLWQCGLGIYEFTPTHIIGQFGPPHPYKLKGDSLYYQYDDTSRVLVNKVSFNSKTLYIIGDYCPTGMSYTRYDPEAEKKQQEELKKFEEGWEKAARKRQKNRGDELDGEIIKYCPRCGENASQAYAVSNGMLIEEPHFVKGASFVCYSCAKKLLKRR